MELEDAMAGRVRRHMITSVAGIAIGVGFFIVAGVIGSQRPELSKAIPAALGIVGFLVMPAIGLTSTFKNLRCPSCERHVISQVSWNYSLFSARASKTCPGCGQRIFGDLVGKRFRRAMIVMVCTIFAFILLAGVGGFVAQKNKVAHASAPSSASSP